MVATWFCRRTIEEQVLRWEEDLLVYKRLIQHFILLRHGFVLTQRFCGTPISNELKKEMEEVVLPNSIFQLCRFPTEARTFDLIFWVKCKESEAINPSLHGLFFLPMKGHHTKPFHKMFWQVFLHKFFVSGIDKVFEHQQVVVFGTVCDTWLFDLVFDDGSHDSAEISGELVKKWPDCRHYRP